MINDNLKKVVNEKDISRVRAIILRQINSDRSKLNFDFVDSCSYAERELAKDDLLFFDVDDGESSISDLASTWSKESWQELRIEFEYNFSKVKMERIISIMNYLRQQGVPEFVVESSQKSSRTLSTSIPVTNDISSSKKSGALRDIKYILPTESHDLNVHQEKPYLGRESDHKLTNKANGKNVLVASIGGAVLGGVIANFARLTVVGVILGAIVGAGIGLANRKTKD